MGLAPSTTLEQPKRAKEIRRKMSKLERRRMWGDWAFIAPQLFIFVFLTIVPLIIAVPILFTDKSQFNDPSINQVGWSNFTAMFTDPSVPVDRA